MCWSSGMAYGPRRLASCPSRSLNLVCKIPIVLLGLSETNTIGCIAQSFHGLDGPLPLACLLFRVTVIIPRLLITAPRREEVIDDHKYFVGDSQRRLLLADTYFETPKGAAQEGGRFPGAPGTLHQDPAQITIPLTRFAGVPFARTLMVPGTDPSP